MFGMIASVGLSNLQFVDLNSARNLFIIGFALFMGISVPEYFSSLKAPVLAGSWSWLGEIAHSIGSSGMSVSAIIAFTLDNTIPGDGQGARAHRLERPLLNWARC